MRGMLDSQDNYFLRRSVGCVIDQIAVALCHELAHAFDLLLPPDMRKQNEALERFKNSGAHAKRGRRVSFTDVGGDFGKVSCRSRRETKFHCSKRRNAASISASVANWRRLACARPSSTAGRCAGSISSGSPSFPVKVSMASAM